MQHAIENMKKPKQLRTTFTTYRLIQCIGEGGSGAVYSAREENGAEFAIKILDPDKAAKKEKLKRFENEYRFCSQNKHPNIITVLDHGLSEDQAPFFVMPLYKGSLRQLIGKLTPQAALTVFEKILDGVDAAHKQGVTHRDLKPENILANDSTELVIADFGIAEFEEEELYTAVETRDGARLANFQYAAPEQRTRGEKIDKRADIYAIGLILNELFTTQLAHGTNYKTIASVTSAYPYLDSLVERMLQQNPTSRYNDIDEIKRELIARGEEHVSMQRLSKLKATVIPTSEIDDPLAADPMRIVGGSLG